MVLDRKIPRKILNRRIRGREHDGRIPRKHWYFPRKVLDQGILGEHTHTQKILESTRKLLEWL